MEISTQEVRLVERARDGDLRAIDNLVRLWTPRVRGFVGRLCPVTEALDVTQEALTVLVDRLGSLRSVQALVSWTFQIVKRRCIQAFWRLRRETALVRELEVLGPASAIEGPRRDRLIQIVTQALSELEPWERQALLSSDVEGLSNFQAAGRFGLTEAAYKSRLHRARTRLRQKVSRGIALLDAAK